MVIQIVANMVRESHLVDAGPGGQEHPDDVCVPVLGGVVERSVAALVDEVHVLRPGQELLHLVELFGIVIMIRLPTQICYRDSISHCDTSNLQRLHFYTEDC